MFDRWNRNDHKRQWNIEAFSASNIWIFARKNFWNFVYLRNPLNLRDFNILFCISVSKELGTLAVLQLGGWCVHATDAVFWRRLQTRVSWPWDLEAVYETVCQDHQQSAHCLRRYYQGRVSKPNERWTNCKLLLSGLCIDKS